MSTTPWHTIRVKEKLKRIISTIINNKLRDPRIPPVVSIAGITLSPDTRNATVYVSIFGSEQEKKGALIALGRAAPFIQKLAASQITVKHFPKLVFKNDTTLDDSDHINELLEQIKDDLDQPE